MAQKKRGQKPLKREFSAGGAVYKKRVKEFLWLVIQPAGTKRWQLPKGNIEQGERAQEAAVREVFEETNVRGRVIDKIDTVRYFYVREGVRIAKSVTFFLMEYTGGSAGVSQAAEHEIGAVEFMPTEEAITRLTFKDDKEVVRKAERMLGKPSQSRMF